MPLNITAFKCNFNNFDNELATLHERLFMVVTDACKFNSTQEHILLRPSNADPYLRSKNKGARDPGAK
jgi:hypothetical protein